MSVDETCYVYLIGFSRAGKFEGPVKVGITSNVGARLKGLQTGHHEKLVIGAYLAAPNRQIALALEDCFHNVFAQHRLEGEWFDMHPVKALRGLCDTFTSALDHFLSEDEVTHEAACEHSGLNQARKLLSAIEQGQQ